MNFLFWNIHKFDSFFSTIKDIVAEEDIDVLLLAEFPKGDDTSINALVQELKSAISDYVYLKPNRKEKVQVFYRTSKVSIINKYEGDYVVAKEIHSKEGEFSIIPCHLRSILGTDKSSLASNANDFCDDLLNYENTKAYHKNTIICGDFNMSPFDNGMVECKSFNATMDASIANQRIRTINKKEYNFFYNPMWNLLGDCGVGKTPGTYFYDKPNSSNIMWYIYDQVILRPDVIPFFDINSLKIATKGSTYNLLTSNGKLNSAYSDHLPIKFKINI